MNEKFNMLMEAVDERFRAFVNQINEYLTVKGCKCKTAKKQRCRYMDFQPTLSEENNPYIKQLLENELQQEILEGK